MTNASDKVLSEQEQAESFARVTIRTRLKGKTPIVAEPGNPDTPELTVKDVNQKLISFMEEVNEMWREIQQQLDTIMDWLRGLDVSEEEVCFPSRAAQMRLEHPQQAGQNWRLQHAKREVRFPS